MGVMQPREVRVTVALTVGLVLLAGAAPRPPALTLSVLSRLFFETMVGSQLTYTCSMRLVSASFASLAVMHCHKSMLFF